MRHINKLSKQLVWLVGFIFVILFIILGLVLPKMLIPVAENNIYNYLREPLQLVNGNVDYKLLDTEIAYIYVVGDNVLTTENLQEELGIDNVSSLMKKITNEYGKIEYKHKYYYYYAIENERVKKIAITNDSYINKTKTEILGSIFPIVLGTCLLIGLILIAWSTIIVKKIEKLKNKIDNIDNPDYNHKIDFEVDDEIKSLGLAIEDMRLSLINQEEYRNQMYQNISHDFKTPLTVIKSYIEAIEDGVQDEKNGLKIIKQEINKLEIKVHSLLYLNKLTYFKDMENYKSGNINVVDILEASISKFKLTRPDIKWQLDILDTKTTFKGTKEMWEAIIDNILSNFIRYARKEVKITVKGHKITFYNDGENIDETIMNDMFTPYKKGIKGQFGLGLSIVKQTLSLLGYEVVAKNEKIGISFIIK